MGATEALREALLDLEEARKLEAQQRRMAEALLAGLHVLVASGSATDIFPKLFDVLREPLDFRAAFVLAAGSDGLLVPIAASDVRFKNTLWNPGTAFKRAMKGKPIAVFDTEAVEEWRRQGDELRKQNRSALVFSVGTETRPALFICTHPARGHFSLLHVNLARRFSVLAVQALMKMEADQRVANLEERLKNEARLAELNRKLAESEKKLARAGKLEALGLLAGSVAHDLNNILSGIVSYPDLLLMSPDLPQKQRRIIETIRASGLRAAAVVQDLLTVSRGVAVIQDTVRLNDLIEQFLAGPEYLEIMKDTEGISVQVNLDERPRNIRASRIHVEKALANLFVNALDAVRGGEDGIIGIKTETVHVDRPRNGYEDIALGEYAILTVSDNGPGISEEDRERIFEPFYTKKKMGKSGTGLGLTVVWNIMQDHNGYIDLRTGGKGTQFSLYFPVVRESIADREPLAALSDYRGRGERILVVDDQEEQRLIACNMLSSLGYEAVAVAGGEEAVAYLENEAADLVLLDMVMSPGIDGRETYERIIRIRPDQKAVIASGYSLNDDVLTVQRLGAGAFLKKPYILEELGMAVKRELFRG